MTTAIAIPGFMLLDEQLQPVVYNTAAMQILTYPIPPEGNRHPSAFLKDRIKSRLLRENGDSHTTFVKEYRSGRRIYICRAFRFDCKGPNEGLLKTALLMERRQVSTSGWEESLKQFNLTQRELETVALLVEGLTSKQIATRMKISPNTVKAFLRLVMVKMGVSTRSGIVGKIVGPHQ